MKKILVTIDNLDTYICQTTGKMYVDNNNMILTPGAKDELSKRKISIVYGPRSEAAGCASPVDPFAGVFTAEPGCKGCGAGLVGSGSSEIEKLMFAIAAMLQEEYGITDPQELRALSYQVITTLQKNI